MDNVGIETRLREISDQIVQLRMYAGIEPANNFLIELLEMERQNLIKATIRVVKPEDSNI